MQKAFTESSRKFRRNVPYVLRSPATAFLAGMLAGCAPHLDIALHSFPPGAKVFVEGTEQGLRTPAFVSREFPPPETAEGIPAYQFALERDGVTARARLLCSAAPGGVQTDWKGRLLIRTVESMDGSAWIIPQDRLLEARFPQRGRSYLVIRWWQAFRRSAFRLDGRDVQSAGDWMQVFSLPAGSHELSGIDWTVHMDLPEGFCIQADQLRGVSGPQNLLLDYEDEQFARVTTRDSEGREQAAWDQKTFRVNAGEALTVDFETRDGRRCGIRLKSARGEGRMQLRVTTHKWR